MFLASEYFSDPSGLVFPILIMIAFCAAGWVVYSTARKPLFVIRFTAAGTRVVRGSPPARFVSALEGLRQAEQITRGRVVGTTLQRRIRVASSSNLPAILRQRVRNLWSAYG